MNLNYFVGIFWVGFAFFSFTQSSGQTLTVPMEQILYYQCANEMQVYALGKQLTSELISFETEKEKVVVNPENPGIITLVPKQHTYQLTELKCKNGKTLSTAPISFEVMSPPHPKITMLVDGEAFVPGAYISRTAILTVTIEPDPWFARTHPEEAKYEFSPPRLLDTYKHNETVAIFKPQNADSKNVFTLSLGGIVDNSPPGSKFYVAIDEFVRVNFQQEKIKEAFTNQEKYQMFFLR